MDKKELTKYLPGRGAGVAGIRQLVELGYPTIAPVTKALLSNLERTPFPSNDTDVEIVNILMSAGDFIRDEVAGALTANRSPQKKYILLSQILPYWTKDQLIPLQDIIYGFVEGNYFHDLDVWALKIMIEKDLDGHNEPMEWLPFKKKVYEQKLQVLSEINKP